MENRYFTILAIKLSSVWLITVLSAVPTYRKGNENFILVLQSISERKPSLCKSNPLLIFPLSIYLTKHVVRERVVTVVCMGVCRCMLDKDARAKSPNRNIRITENWKLKKQEAPFLMRPSKYVL